MEIDAIKFTAEVSDTNTMFLDTSVYKGERFANESILDIKTHFKPTETFQYTRFSSYHPPGVKKGFIKGEAVGFSGQTVSHFKTHLKEKGYPETGQCKTKTADCGPGIKWRLSNW